MHLNIHMPIGLHETCCTVGVPVQPNELLLQCASLEFCLFISRKQIKFNKTILNVFIKIKITKAACLATETTRVRYAPSYRQAQQQQQQRESEKQHI